MATTISRRKKTPEQPMSQTLPQPPSFDMSKNPCVYVARIGGVAPETMSLRQIIEGANTVASIAHPSPSVWLGLMRMLVCTAQRVASPKNVQAVQALVENWLDQTSVSDYFDKAEEKGWFDLFHAKHPLYQVSPELLSDPVADVSLMRKVGSPANEQSAAKLTLVYSAGAENVLVRQVLRRRPALFLVRRDRT